MIRMKRALKRWPTKAIEVRLPIRSKLSPYPAGTWEFLPMVKIIYNFICCLEYVQIMFRYRVGFEAFTAVTMNNAVFWDMKPQIVPHRKHYLYYRA
jgi:hypothetical protein